MELKGNDSGRIEDGDRPVDHGRRNAMRKIAVGMGVLATYSILPDQWTKPIIGQVVLPAHAATSGSTLNDPCSVVLTAGTQATASVTILVTGFVTPPTANLPIAITAVAAGGGNAAANVVTNASGNYSAVMTIGGGPGITSVSVTSVATGADGVAQCGVNVPAVATTTIMPSTTLGTSTISPE